MNTNKHNSRAWSFLDWPVFLCLAFAAFASFASDSLNVLALYGAIPFAFVVSLIKSRRLFVNRYETIISFLYLWVAFSSLWAAYPDLARQELHRVLGAFLMCYIVSVQASKSSTIAGMYIIFIILYVGAWYYASSHMLIVTDFAENERANDQKLNANTLAYYTFYVTFVLYILSEILSYEFWQKILRGAFLLMIPLSFFVALTTASRQVLIIQVPLLVLLLFQRYYRKERAIQKLLFIVVLVVAGMVFLPRLESIYQSSYLAERSQMSVLEDTRYDLIKESIDVGLEHFPLGVGAGNYQKYSRTHHFSHNTFTELFANTGIVGFVLFLILIVSFIKKQWERLRITKDRFYGFFLTFGLLFLVDQFFYVFYADMWLMSFFVLVATHSDTYYKSTTFYSRIR